MSQVTSRTVGVSAVLAVVCLAWSVMLGGTTDYGDPRTAPTAVVLCVLMVPAALGWAKLQSLSPTWAHTAVMAGTGIAAVLATSARTGDHFAWSMAVIALGLIGSFVIELARGTGAGRRLESVIGSATGVVLLGLGAGWIAALAESTQGADLVRAALFSLLLASAIAALPWPDRLTAPLCIVVSAATAPLAVLAFDDVSGWLALTVGILIGLAVAASRRLVFADDGPRTRLSAIGAGVPPVLAIGSVVHLAEFVFIRAF